MEDKCVQLAVPNKFFKDWLLDNYASTIKQSLQHAAGIDVDAEFCDIDPPMVASTFRRGDADGSGKIDLTDAIFTLEFQFMGGKAPDCYDAADADDSGALDLTDAIYSLQFQFMGGNPPAAPGPYTCGPDPTTGDPYTECAYTNC